MPVLYPQFVNPLSFPHSTWLESPSSYKQSITTPNNRTINIYSKQTLMQAPSNSKIIVQQTSIQSPLISDRIVRFYPIIFFLTNFVKENNLHLIKHDLKFNKVTKMGTFEYDDKEGNHQSLELIQFSNIYRAKEHPLKDKVKYIFLNSFLMFRFL